MRTKKFGGKGMLKIVTDSSSEISEEEAKRLGIEIVPLTVTLKEGARLEGRQIQKEEFYERLKGGEFPKTSQPSAAQFFDAFLRTDGQETLCILLSSALSGTVNAAELAKRDGNFSNVTVYDSRCVSAMLRFLVRKAVEMRDRRVGEVVKELDALRPRLRLFAFLDTLEYLRRGGRIKRGTAFFGEFLKIKPIITIDLEGQVKAVGKARGQGRAMEAVKELFEKEEPDERYPLCFLQTDSGEPAKKLMQTLQREGELLSICCAVGTHIGPNAAGVCYVAKNS